MLVGVLGCTLIYGNIALVAMSWAARPISDLDQVEGVPTVRHLIAVDDRVWRGAEPNADGFRELAAHGVVTVVDLRPGTPSRRDDVLVRSLGMEVVHIPVIDGRTPAASQVRSFEELVRRSRGRVFLHCGEGVGRAGTMAAAYKVTTGQTDARTAVRESLAVGVLTLEQIAFIAGLDRDGVHRPPALAVIVSRYLDGPRQLYNKFL
jgi:protein tyrosine phosphatase (PTP) superfamily phosphohydrolase (DUF442 family)